MADEWPASNAGGSDDALLDEAIRLSAEERTAFLDRVCGTDEARRRELLSLIDAHESAGRFLQTPVLLDPLAHLPVAGKDELIGAPIGSYRVLDRVGTGGMGAVYLAERADRAFERRVAIKVIKRGMDTDEVLHRFRRERELLAGLDHPNIARLLDGGAMEPPDGRPYLVMEHVAGTRIDHYCDERGLPVRDRLELFRQACEAVQHAHQRLIVHRDLKPSNILVTESEGSTESRPAVKLLDFGIARVLSGSEIDVTATGARFVTPRYGSPEQLRGEPVSTSTDVYSLGVILYELLTGRHPYASFNGEAVALSKAELDAAMQTTEPRRPSAAVLHDAQRGSDGEHLRRSRKLAGDLDTIVMKAIEKEPERRYASVSALAEDVGRYLAGEPIAARSPSMAEQARRFVRRNPALTGIVTAAAIGLMLTAIGTSVGFVRAMEATREARAQQAVAEQFGAFLTEMLTSVTPHIARGRDTALLREILHSAEERLDDEQVTRSMPPEALISLHNVIGSTYRGIGDYEESRRRYESSLELSRAFLPANHPATLSSLLGLANTLTDAGQHPSAAPYTEEAHAMALALYGRDHADTAMALNAMARISVIEGRYDEAEGQFREALDAARRVSGETSMQTLTIMNNLADLLDVRGRFAEAESIFAEVAAIRQQTLPPDHPDVLVSMSNLAKVRSTMGDLAGAVAAQREVLEIRRRILGPDHNLVATTLINIAVTLNALGDVDAAVEATREAIDIYRRTLDADHPWIAKGLSNLGVMLAREGHLDEAEQLHREALEMRLRRFGGDHAEVAMSLHSLGALYAERGEFALSEKYHLEALAMRRAVFGAEHPHVAVSIESLGRLWLDFGDREGQAHAQRLFREALEMRRALLGERHTLVARTMCQLAEALIEEGILDEALGLLEEALAQQRELLPPHHRATAATLRLLGLALTRSERAADAWQYLEEALKIDRRPPPPPPHIRARTLAVVAECLVALGNDEQAVEVLDELLEGLAMHAPYGRRHPVVGRALANLGAMLARLGRFEEGRRALTEAVDILQETLGIEHSIATAAAAALAAIGEG